jgi:hypothetical protein
MTGQIQYQAAQQQARDRREDAAAQRLLVPSERPDRPARRLRLRPALAALAAAVR